ncbi:hypothetical protein [Puniceicoccus vermicola]|uniref:Uncharacterized protein n=1 Tax=Puniceicoccus vermicola TaxID=388746 RepID=A0A7X1B084_9BACT|nr:hypothetical protein [Puniceicoccus vermicola]MBC2602100.1 hypothetical protein [Puniceicoccus vermicola]
MKILFPALPLIFFLTASLFSKTFLKMENFDPASEEDSLALTEGFAMIFENDFQKAVYEHLEETTQSPVPQNLFNILEIQVYPNRGEILLFGIGKYPDEVEKSFARTFMRLRLQESTTERLEANQLIQMDLQELEEQLSDSDLKSPEKEKLEKRRKALRAQFDLNLQDQRSRWSTWRDQPQKSLPTP